VREPASKLDFMLSDTRVMARFSGEAAAFAPVLATLPRPEATPDAPD
jgi:hypothetical protein